MRTLFFEVPFWELEKKRSFSAKIFFAIPKIKLFVFILGNMIEDKFTYGSQNRTVLFLESYFVHFL